MTEGTAGEVFPFQMQLTTPDKLRSLLICLSDLRTVFESLCLCDITLIDFCNTVRGGEGSAVYGTMAPPTFMGLTGRPLSLMVSTVATTGFVLFGYDQGVMVCLCAVIVLAERGLKEGSNDLSGLKGSSPYP